MKSTKKRVLVLALLIVVALIMSACNNSEDQDVYVNQLPINYVETEHANCKPTYISLSMKTRHILTTVQVQDGQMPVRINFS